MLASKLTSTCLCVVCPWRAQYQITCNLVLAQACCYTSGMQFSVCWRGQLGVIGWLQGRRSFFSTCCLQVQEPLDCVIRMLCYNFGALLEQLFLQVGLPDRVSWLAALQ